jgi:hypothetical protein
MRVMRGSPPSDARDTALEAKTSPPFQRTHRTATRAMSLPCCASAGNAATS